MFRLTDAQRDQFRTAVGRAAGRPEVAAAVRRVYRSLAARVAARRPVCDASGRCCRFEEYGHRLFVTTVELAAFAASVESEPSEWDGTGCRYQAGGKCGVHADRPFGCRMFYCDPTAGDWQEAEYERYHKRLKRLHAALGVPYYYVEWREALGAAGLASSDSFVAKPRAAAGGITPLSVSGRPL